MLYILAAEDEVSQRLTLKKYLSDLVKKSGLSMVTVIICADGIELLETFKKHAKHVIGIVTDTQMGGEEKDSGPAITAIRDWELENSKLYQSQTTNSSSKIKPIPIISYSANSTINFKEELLKRGATAFFEKPYEFEQIYSIFKPYIEDIKANKSESKPEKSEVRKIPSLTNKDLHSTIKRTTSEVYSTHEEKMKSVRIMIQKSPADNETTKGNIISYQMFKSGSYEGKHHFIRTKKLIKPDSRAKPEAKEQSSSTMSPGKFN